MFLNMISQQTLLEYDQHFWAIYPKPAAKMNEWKFAVANFITWHFLTKN